MKRSFSIHFFGKLILLALLYGSFVEEAHGQFDPDAIKSAYLERITRFIDWPPSKALDTSAYFIIGVVNENDFVKVLSDVFSYKQILGKDVRFITLKNPDDLASCNLCYLGGIRRSQLELYTAMAKKTGALLVSDTHGYGKNGVHFNFVLVDQKVRFEINEEALKVSGFKVSHLLYKSGIVL